MATDFVIELGNRLSEIDRLVDALAAFCETQGVPPRPAGHLELALHELVTNVISYAWEDGREHRLTVRVVLADGRLTAEIVDDGHPFDPLVRPDPDIGAPLEERGIGGLGIHFVKRVVDSVAYRRDGPFNRLTLIKTISQEEKT